MTSGRLSISRRFSTVFQLRPDRAAGGSFPSAAASGLRPRPFGRQGSISFPTTLRTSGELGWCSRPNEELEKKAPLRRGFFVAGGFDFRTPARPLRIDAV